MKFYFLWGLAATIFISVQASKPTSHSKTAAHDAWHTEEIIRWLADNNLKIPSLPTRADLEDLIAKNWDSKSTSSFDTWDINSLHSFLDKNGVAFEKSSSPEISESYKNKLLRLVKGTWSSSNQYQNWSQSKSAHWVFERWDDSAIEKFLSHYKTPFPTKRDHDSLLQTAQKNYDSIANSLMRISGENEAWTYYPGDWVYASWSDSELRQWLLEQSSISESSLPTTRAQLIALLRNRSHGISVTAIKLPSSILKSVNGASHHAANTFPDIRLRSWASSLALNLPEDIRSDELIALLRHQLTRELETAKREKRVFEKELYRVSKALSNCVNGTPQPPGILDRITIFVSDAIETANITFHQIFDRAQRQLTVGRKDEI